MKVSVVYSPSPRQVREWVIELPANSKVQQALEGCGIGAEFPELGPGQLMLGVWGKQAQPGQVLHDGDRIEVYRSLQVDPKVARRERFRRQGAKTAGLFAQKRAGSKAGY